MVVQMSGFMKQTRNSLLNLSGAFKQLNKGFNSVCAQFKNKKILTESPKRKKASLAAFNTIMVSTPNPNLVAAAVSVDTGVSEPTANMDTADSGEVTVSGSLVVKKSSVPATLPTVPIGQKVPFLGLRLVRLNLPLGDVRNCQLFHIGSNYLFIDSPQILHLRMFWNLYVKNSHPRILQLNNFDFHTLVVDRLLKYLLRLMC